MRDNRFIELVNLYIDRQITADETAELEAEMQANPRRRAVYRQYCQLHSASKQVYAGFRAQASEPQADAPAGRVVRAEFSRRPRSNWIHYVGGAAAAACLAVAFVRYNANSTSSMDALAADAARSPATQVAVVTPAAPAPESVSAASAVPDAVSTRAEIAVAAEPNYSALLAALRQEEQRAFTASALQSGQLPSLFDDGVFDTRPANNQRVFRGKQAPTQQAEFTAFQFQR